MNTRGLLDQLLKSGQELLNKQSGPGKPSTGGAGLGSLQAGAGQQRAGHGAEQCGLVH